MGRPKYAAGETPARERIEEAFWRLLEGGRYDTITIRALAAEARVNHNSIYYYYENLDSVARHAFAGTLLQDLPEMLEVALSGQLEQYLSRQDQVQRRLRKIQLMAASESVYLRGMLKEGLRTAWLSQGERDWESLSALEQLEVDFIFSGIVSMLGRGEPRELLPQMMAFLRGDLGRSVLGTMKKVLE